MSKSKKNITKRKRMLAKFHANKEKKNSFLTPTDYVLLIDLFRTKNWPVNDSNPRSPFNRYFKTMEGLNDKQKRLFLDLSKRFHWIRDEAYVRSIINLLNRIFEDHPNRSYTSIRCVNEEDEYKNKSSNYVQYDIKSAEVQSYLNHKIGEITSLRDYDSKKYEGELLVILDDFIGTGETATGAVDYITRKLSVTTNDFVILSIACMKEGYNLLTSRGYKVYTEYLLDKGISGHYKNEKLKEALATMKSIEEARCDGLKKKFRFGYKQSEALVCMKRCPNNTFPIYWKPKDVAPYERY